jgi:hypothetical protein
MSGDGTTVQIPQVLSSIITLTRGAIVQPEVSFFGMINYNNYKFSDEIRI